MSTLISLLRNTAQNFPNHQAIYRESDGNPRFLTWTEYLSRIAKAAGMFSQLGLKQGDRFAIISKNSPYHAELINAGYWAGMIPVPINFRLSPVEISDILKDAHCQLIFVEDIFIHLIEQVQHFGNTIVVIPSAIDSDSISFEYRTLDSVLNEADPIPAVSLKEDDDAIWLFTGGTTARGKGVRLSHRNIISNAFQTANFIRPSSRDVYLHISPMFHSTDLKATVVTMFGGSHVYLSEFSTEAVVKAIEQQKVSILSLVPTTLVRFLKETQFEDVDLATLRLISYGTSPMDDNWLRFAHEKLPQVEFHQCYGLTETSPYLSILDGNDHQRAFKDSPHLLHSAGKILPATEMRIVDEEGLDVVPGALGELIVKGPQVSKGYMNAPDEMRDAYIDGWFYTGDIAQMDDAGYLYIRDRKKEMVKTGGENVYTREVEIVLLKHPKIMEVAVVGIPDDIYGEALLAVIVPKSGVNPGDPEIACEVLIGFCRSSLGGYKIPRKYLIVDELPRTALGKVKKTALKELHQNGENLS